MTHTLIRVPTLIIVLQKSNFTFTEFDVQGTYYLFFQLDLSVTKHNLTHSVFNYLERSMRLPAIILLSSIWSLVVDTG